MSSCSIRFCTNRSSKNPELKFFRYPKDEQILHEWLKVSRSGINLKNARVCSLHFANDAFWDCPFHNLKRPIKPDAVPTLFVPNDEHSDDESLSDSNSQPVTAHEKQDNSVLSKLKLVLYASEYCTLCLNSNNLSTLDTQIEDSSLNEILAEVFGGILPSLQSSFWLCEECKTKTIDAYNFIKNTKSISKVLNLYLDNIDQNVRNIDGNKLEDIENVVLRPSLLKTDDYNVIDNNYDIKNYSEDIKIVPENLITYDEELNSDFVSDHGGINPENKIQERKYLMEKHQTKRRCTYCNLKLRKDRPHNRCKYGCPECKKRPCVHDKYLNSFYRQKDSGKIEVKCPDCKHSAVKKTEYIAHVNRDHINRFTYLCERCSQRFYSKRSLSYHKYIFHTELYTCEYCDVDFRNKNILASHIQTCQKEIRAFGCDKCAATFNEAENIIAHTKKRHENVFSCNECLFKCGSLRGLKIHSDATHSGKALFKKSKMTCSVCSADFSIYSDYRMHLKNHENQKYFCRCCNRSFDSRARCILHENKNLFNYKKCNQCSKQIKATKFEAHIITHENLPHLCDACGKNFGSEQNLKQHIKTHIGRQPCKICNKDLKNTSLQAHMLRHRAECHPKLASKLIKRSKFHCSDCNYTTRNKNYLESHINRQHLKIKPYKCDSCSKEFTAEFLLQIHKESHQKKNFPCDLCEKTFGARLGLKLHIRRRHTGEKPYSCDICNASFISSSTLSNHKRIAHMEKTAICPLCQSLFHDYSRVRMHIKRVHWKGGKVFDLRDVEGINEEHLRLLDDRRTSLYYSKYDAVT